MVGLKNSIRWLVVVVTFAAMTLAGAHVTASAQTDTYSADTTFLWTDVPQDQMIPLNSASFDEGGYQLYDTQGETIVVPFSNHDLYVMKFQRSQDANMYFVNSGGNVPILYVPRHAYLSNATVPGARWYPFPRNFNPPSPVYIGIAPDWATFTTMGWYPDMYYRGGYWGQSSGLFVAIPGLMFQIGGARYVGWDAYRNYYAGHSGYVHPGYRDRTIYRTVRQPNRDVKWGQRRNDNHPQSPGPTRPVFNPPARNDQSTGDHRLFQGGGSGPSPSRPYQGVGNGYHGTPTAPPSTTRPFQGGSPGNPGDQPRPQAPTGQTHGTGGGFHGTAAPPQAPARPFQGGNQGGQPHQQAPSRPAQSGNSSHGGGQPGNGDHRR
jgi:hypothetical protein